MYIILIMQARTQGGVGGVVRHPPEKAPGNFSCEDLKKNTKKKKYRKLNGYIVSVFLSARVSPYGIRMSTRNDYIRISYGKQCR